MESTLGPLCLPGGRALLWAIWATWALLVLGCNGTGKEGAESQRLELPGEPVVGASWPDGTKKIEWHITAGDTVGMRAYHANGEVDREGALDAGQRSGTWQAYHPNGNPWARHEYRDGKQVGAYQTWHPNGTPHITGQYDADGRRTGTWIFQDSTGAIVGEKRFDLPVAPESGVQP
jgi:antitoxin component YwqK of YwqJK toxin-antitoxin module